MSRNPDILDKSYNGFEDKLQKAYEESFGNDVQSNGNKLHLFTGRGFGEALMTDINHDFSLIGAAILLVCVYVVLFLGSFSPMHCRLIVALVGLLSILMAYTAGFGILYYLGAESTGVHQLMPFLLVGIGADDMFVLCNSIDQTNLNHSTSERIVSALGHSGPAITITSLTNALAFAFGSTTSLPALKSFCMFASVCIVMLYLLVNTMFLAVVVWDTRRVEKRWGECCGLCGILCKEDTILCCKGKLLAQKQRDYSKIEASADEIAKFTEEENKADAALKTTLKASTSEKFLGKYFAPIILSKIGRIVFLVIYVILIAFMSYGASQLRIHFEIDFFISKESSTFGWFAAKKEYFDSSGAATVIYIESDELDFTDTAVQDKVIALNSNLEACTGCEEEWHEKNTLNSWFNKYIEWVALGNCAAYRPTTNVVAAVPQSKFNSCLAAFSITEKGQMLTKNIARRTDNTI